MRWLWAFDHSHALFQFISSIKAATRVLLVAILHQLMACLFVCPIAQRKEREIRSAQLYYLFHEIPYQIVGFNGSIPLGKFNATCPTIKSLRTST